MHRNGEWEACGIDDLPVLVIGAGPPGLAAAAHLLERGVEPLVVEAGDGPAAAAEWGHVRLFSPWPELVDKAAVRLLRPSGWTAPEQGYPAGAEWIDRYLRPLAEALGGRVRYGTRVTGVSRRGRDRLVDAGRGSAVHRARHRPGRCRTAAFGAGGDRRVRDLAAVLRAGADIPRDDRV
jgi:cation diffusion facilitator CzcD-associated flavoprotein CzcO